MQPPLAARTALVLAGLMWVVPFVQPLAWKPLVHFFHEWFAVVLGLGACTVLIARSPRPVIMPAASVALLAFALLLSLQPLALPLPYWEPSLSHAAFVVWAIAIAVSGRRLRDVAGIERCMAVLAGFAVAGGCLSACIGLVQRFEAPAILAAVVPRTSVTVLIAGAIRHQSWYADHLLLGLAATGWVAATGRLSPVPAALAGLTMVAAAALTGSRAPLLMLAVGWIIAVGAYRRTRAAWAGRLILWQTLWALSYAVIVLAIPHLPDGGSAAETTLGRLMGTGDGMGLGARWGIWRRAAMSVLESPLRGYGPDGYAWAAYRVADGPTIPEYTIHAHNLPLQILVETGAIGFAVFFVVVLLAARSIRNEWTTPGGWLCTVMVAVIAIRSCLDLPTNYAFFLGPLALLVGIASAGGLVIAAGRLRAATAGLVTVGLALSLHALEAYRNIASLWQGQQSATSLTARYRAARHSVFFAPLVDSIMADAAALDRSRAQTLLPVYARYLRWRTHPRATMRYGAFLALAGHDSAACRWVSRATHIYPDVAAEFARSLDRNSTRSDPALTPLRRQITQTLAGVDGAALCGPEADAAGGGPNKLHDRVNPSDLP